MKVYHESVSFSYGYDIPDEMCYQSTKQVDGLDCGVTPFYSAVINGRGKYEKLHDFKDAWFVLTVFQKMVTGVNTKKIYSYIQSSFTSH